MDFCLQLDEVGRPMHDSVIGDVEMLQRRQFGQFIGQLVEQVIGHVETDQTLQFVDVLGQLCEIIAC